MSTHEDALARLGTPSIYDVTSYNLLTTVNIFYWICLVQVLTPRKLDSDFDQSMEAEEDQAARVIEPKGNSFISIHFF